MMAPRSQRQVSALPKGPFARPFDVRSLKGEPRETAIVADEAERAAVAASLALGGVAEIAASFRLSPRAGGIIALSGKVRAAVTQTCVVSLDPFDSILEQAVALDFAPAAQATTMRIRGVEVEIPPPSPVGGNDEQEDPPDPIVDDTIDLGAVAVEFLVLALDPYPRKPGVHFDDTVVDDKDAPAPSAFAALARLKDDS